MSKISELSWIAFKEKVKDTQTVIIPTGAIECYGPHLPLGTDTLVAEKIAEMLADKLDAFIAPTLAFGDSTSMQFFPGTLVAKPESFKAYFNDLVQNLIRWGMTTIIVINGHAGNTPMINQVCYTVLSEKPEVELMQIDWWRYAMANGSDIFEEKGYMAHGHASECATSVMLYLYPELVALDKLQIGHPKTINSKKYPNIIKYTNFESFSDLGMIGDATKGTKAKGERLINQCLQNILKAVEECNGQ